MPCLRWLCVCSSPAMDQCQGRIVNSTTPLTSTILLIPRGQLLGFDLALAQANARLFIEGRYVCVAGQTRSRSAARPLSITDRAPLWELLHTLQHRSSTVSAGRRIVTSGDTCTSRPVGHERTVRTNHGYRRFHPALTPARGGKKPGTAPALAIDGLNQAFRRYCGIALVGDDSRTTSVRCTGDSTSPDAGTRIRLAGRRFPEANWISQPLDPRLTFCPNGLP
ncbi:hypothetical protein JOH48_002770 [Bradyrhizobium elkanii]|nr:hypothetical protein [Bradyrhizobium elkanii]